ncbi:MAG: hypothetical protein QXP55_04155 [Nitrososphaerales archaeon]
MNKEGITFTKVPTMLVFRRGLSKARNFPLMDFDPKGVKKNKFLRITLVTRDVKRLFLGLALIGDLMCLGLTATQT